MGLAKLNFAFISLILFVGAFRFSSENRYKSFRGKVTKKLPTEPTVLHTTNANSTTPADFSMNQPVEQFLIAQSGSGIEMDCFINLTLKISWTKVGMDGLITINNNTIFWDKRFLSVRNDEANKWTLKVRFVQPHDAGTYRCELSGIYSSIRYYHLNVKRSMAKILGSEIDKKREVTVGDVLRISCILEHSIQKPIYIFWYKDHSVINFNLTDGATVRESRQGSELIVPKAELSDQGNYSCVPSNAQQDSICVVILSKTNKKKNIL